MDENNNTKNIKNQPVDEAYELEAAEQSDAVENKKDLNPKEDSNPAEIKEEKEGDIINNQEEEID